MAVSRNPLRCGGTALPTEVLLMAKLIALSLLLTNHVRLMPDPFLPFVPFLEHIAPPAVFQTTLKVVFIGSALALLFNAAVRAAAFALGATILTAVVSSKAYYGNNKTFCGLMLVLAGIYDPRWGRTLLRAQLAIVYFGAGLNKLLDPDWQSGRFFDHWATERLKNPVFIWARQYFPPLALGQAVCWGTMAAELGASAALAISKLQAIGMWANTLFQAGLLLFTGTTFTMFFYAMQAASLVFARWPQQRMLVIYDGDCGFCTASKRFFERLDFEDALDWRPYQSGAGHAHGVTDEMAMQRVYLVMDGKVRGGFAAVRMILMTNPLTWLTLAALIALPPGDAALYRRIIVSLALALFFPAFIPIGEMAYRMVARNRYKIMPGACAIPPRAP